VSLDDRPMWERKTDPDGDLARESQRAYLLHEVAVAAKAEERKRAAREVIENNREAARQDAHPAWQAHDRAEAAGGWCVHCQDEPRRGPHGFCATCNMTRRRTGHLPTAAAIERRRDKRAGYR
jgi:hypothetical protein